MQEYLLSHFDLSIGGLKNKKRMKRLFGTPWLFFFFLVGSLNAK